MSSPAAAFRASAAACGGRRQFRCGASSHRRAQDIGTSLGAGSQAPAHFHVLLYLSNFNRELPGTSPAAGEGQPATRGSAEVAICFRGMKSSATDTWAPPKQISYWISHESQHPEPSLLHPCTVLPAGRQWFQRPYNPPPRGDPKHGDLGGTETIWSWISARDHSKGRCRVPSYTDQNV